MIAFQAISRGQERKAFAQGKAGLRSEIGESAGAGAIGLGTTLIENQTQKIVVRFHRFKPPSHAALGSPGMVLKRTTPADQVWGTMKILFV